MAGSDTIILTAKMSTLEPFLGLLRGPLRDWSWTLGLDEECICELYPSKDGLPGDRLIEELCRLGRDGEIGMRIPAPAAPVSRALMAIPFGQRMTYADLAEVTGAGRATARAVGNRVGANSICFLIPCHRVVRADGSPGGYRWGIEKKQYLLSCEREFVTGSGGSPHAKRRSNQEGEG